MKNGVEAVAAARSGAVRHSARHRAPHRFADEQAGAQAAPAGRNRGGGGVKGGLKSLDIGRACGKSLRLRLAIKPREIERLGRDRFALLDRRHGIDQLRLGFRRPPGPAEFLPLRLRRRLPFGNWLDVLFVAALDRNDGLGLPLGEDFGLRMQNWRTQPLTRVKQPV